MTLHPFLVYIGKTAVEVERIGKRIDVDMTRLITLLINVSSMNSE